MQRPDYEYLTEVADGDETVILEILELVQKEVPVYIEQAKQALKDGNKTALTEKAYLLKRTLSYLRVQQMEKLALQLKAYGEGKSTITPKKAESLVDDLQRKFSGLKNELENAKRELFR